MKVNSTTFFIKRIGTDGDIARAIKLLKDEEYDVAGIGGINFYYHLGKKKYPLVDGQKIKKEILRPIADGGFIKPVLDLRAVNLTQKLNLFPPNFTALLTSYLDRPWLYEGLINAGAQKVFIGDAAFALKLPLFFSRQKLFTLAGILTLPLLRRIPIKFLYPLGVKQEKNIPRYSKIFARCQVVAGDFHFLRRYCPDLTGKVIITTTLREEDILFLKGKGAFGVVGSGGDFRGISPGANLLEALACAYFMKNPGEITKEEYANFLEAISYKPLVQIFSK
ncbi:hypothetical protein [Carboxydothermus pertinax]|uniref:Quinate 5-dehydrogenase n=1 Tax=Carboxydothermus pertinax TaxID=870242 RepID=A0A1L8CSG8_9THEO|nr:hypothetical protein [Carboxydothermus pertinax]GAV21759.1 hypothetical protein cpu_02690 [Carboxydothermus pertinax]